ncbi:MAG: ShlB/FhaC/HecB family hemolysin secretion/activation protein [Deltaproteobacteria bacterium]|nr:ShlB/FhaC/HecB family hemolysin secretion/activation protein [Deltaproteobacteria bacterium]
MHICSYLIRKYLVSNRLIRVAVAVILFSIFTSSDTFALDESEDASFEIIGYTVEGNSILTESMMLQALKGLAGKDKTGSDVEKARQALEAYYHKAGYPAVQVGVPQQTVEDGLVRLIVTESKIRDVRVTGNRYFTRESIVNRLPSLSPGDDIFLPHIIQEFGLANRNPDMKISPVMIPGREPGTIDVELKVTDKLPLHGSLEFSNRSSHSTEKLRLNGSLRYDNLWQKEHSFSIQYQTAPEETDQVKMLAESYVFSAPWNTMHMIALYGVWSDSDTAFAEGLEVIGNGSIYGARYIVPLPALKNLYHNITIGVDYKDFNEDINFHDSEEEDLTTPIAYLPFLVTYSATQADKMGKTQYSLGLNWTFRNLVTDQREFEIKRKYARGDYLYMTAGIERTNKLPLEMSLYAKLDGQIASEPLISNEQYIAGGMESVRGYKESELAGDYAVHSTVEINFPELINALGFKKSRINATLYYFYDIAKVWKKNPLPGEDKSTGIQGVGWGVKGTLFNNFEYRFDWAIALEDTDMVKSGDDTGYFMVKYAF